MGKRVTHASSVSTLLELRLLGSHEALLANCLGQLFAIGQQNLEWNVPPFRVEGYMGPSVSCVGKETGRGNACQKCNTRGNVSSGPDGMAFCYSCWKKLAHIIIQADCDLALDKGRLFEHLARKGYFKKGAVMCGGNATLYPGQAEKDVLNEIVCVLHRMMNPKPTILKYILEGYIKFSREFTPWFLRDLEDVKIMSFDEWNLPFQKFRRNLNLRFWQERTDANSHIFLGMSDQEITKALVQAPFLKMDKDIPTGEKAPRPIMPQQVAVAVVMGIVIKSISKALEKLLSSKTSNVVFACGSNPTMLTEVYRKIKNMEGKNFENDMSQYDSTQHTPFLLTVAEIYDYIFEHYISSDSDPGLIECFRKIRCKISGETYGYTVLGLFVHLAGQMKSGQADTCTGNSLINLFTHIYVLSHHTQLSPQEIYQQILMLLLGDDNAFCIPKTTPYERFKSKEGEATFQALGLAPKLNEKPFDDLVFLNMVAMPCSVNGSDDIMLSVLTGRFLYRLQIAKVEYPDFDAYLVAIAKCVKAIAGFNPILNAFAENLLNLHGKGVNAKGRQRKDRELEKSQIFKRNVGYYLSISENVNMNEVKANDNTYKFLANRYGLSVVDIKRCVNYYENTTCNINTHDLSTIIIQRDADRQDVL